MVKTLALLLALIATYSNASCRQALAFGLDVSGSVDETEYRLQLDGLATALNSEAVQRVLFSTAAAPVHINIFEWSGPLDQNEILPWTALSGPNALAHVTDVLTLHRRAPASPTTALGSAMEVGQLVLAQMPECWTHTLDISGDGKANTGPRPQNIETGSITINALVIGSNDQTGPDQRIENMKELSAYFSSYVIRGPDAFVETAMGFQDYAAAMERKLLRELKTFAIGQLDL